MRPIPAVLLMFFIAAAVPAHELLRDSSVQVYDLVPPGPGTVHIAERRVAPGGVLRVISGESEIIEVVLESSSGRRVSRAASVSLRAGAVASIAGFLLPVDSTLAPGSYTVVARGSHAEHARIGVEVVPREFLSQEISLDRRLTRLRSVPDPEKERQTRELSRLVFSRDPQAVHHTGVLSWPLPRSSRETSAFGVRRRFVYSDGSDARTIHVGVDLAAPTGSAVGSAGAGVVRMAEFRIVTGWTVVVEHLPGVYSLYYHLHTVDVSPGQMVETGHSLGTVGATGLATGAHLHWEVRIAGVAVDPEVLTRVSLVDLFG